MVTQMPLPGAQMVATAVALSQGSFSAFGSVVENEWPHLMPAPGLNQDLLPRNAMPANQGSALRFADVTQMIDLYSSAPSRVSARAVMNMFVCAPRALQCPHQARTGVAGMFPVKILERHPFTSQTFIPLGLSAAESGQARYLVIVAPSLQASPAEEALPVPRCQSARGLPDLENLRAFIATGAQAVTYGPGTWHAPMAVVGQKAIDFVVTQFANGVAIEDCQEVELAEHDGDGVLVEVPQHAPPSTKGLWRL